jgi:hypothetical protein
VNGGLNDRRLLIEFQAPQHITPARVVMHPVEDRVALDEQRPRVALLERSKQRVENGIVVAQCGKRLAQCGASEVYVQNNVWAPGGSTGWHTHPGHSLIFHDVRAETEDV